MAALHVLCGKAGAGKTTLARALGARLPGVVICEDEWLARLGDSVASVNDYVQAAARCRRLIEPLAADLLRLRTSVIFDFAGNTIRDREWALTVARQAGAEAVLHYLPADDDLCRARIRARNRTQPAGIYFGRVTDDQFDEVTRYFQPPGPHEGFALLLHQDETAIA
jgi:predicted kinase